MVTIPEIDAIIQILKEISLQQHTLIIIWMALVIIGMRKT